MRLKELRNEKKLTQQQLAELMKVGRATIAGYEVKNKQPDYVKLIWLADFFDVSLDYILGRTNIKKPLPESNLSDDQKECLTLFNQLPADDKRKITEIIRTLVNMSESKIE